MHSPRYHIIIDIEEVGEKSLKDAQALSTFLEEFPGKIGMSILHGPVVKEGIPENPGITGFIVIDYSHISAHTFTKYGEVLFDIFSCKPYDQEVALEMVLDHFKANPDKARVQTVHWGE